MHNKNEICEAYVYCIPGKKMFHERKATVRILEICSLSNTLVVEVIHDPLGAYPKGERLEFGLFRLLRKIENSFPMTNEEAYSLIGDSLNKNYGKE